MKDCQGLDAAALCCLTQTTVQVPLSNLRPRFIRAFRPSRDPGS